MYQYNHMVLDSLDLYLKGLDIAPHKSYRLEFDVCGGSMNVYINGRAAMVIQSAGSHYTPHGGAWKHITLDFVTGDVNEERRRTFSEWGIAFVKREESGKQTHEEDTYIDNVKLYDITDPQTLLVEGGTFSAPITDAVYDRNWNAEILGHSGRSAGVAVVTDPYDRHNRCLKLPRQIPRMHALDSSVVRSLTWYQDLPNDEVHYTKKTRDGTILLVVNGCIEVSAKEQTIVIHDGQLLYVPSGLPMTTRFVGGKGTAYYGLSVSQSEAAVFAMGIVGLLPITVTDITLLATYIKRMAGVPRESATYLLGLQAQWYSFLVELEKQLTVSRTDKHRTAIEEVAQSIRRHPEHKVDNARLAKQCRISKNYFVRLFREYMGTTPQQYRLHAVADKACLLLQHTDLSIGNVAQELGIENPLYFSRLFRSVCGMSPREFRERLNR